MPKPDSGTGLAPKSAIRSIMRMQRTDTANYVRKIRSLRLRLPISSRLSGTHPRALGLMVTVSLTSLSGCSLIPAEGPSVVSQPAAISTERPVALETARVETNTKTKLALSANALQETLAAAAREAGLQF